MSQGPIGPDEGSGRYVGGAWNCIVVGVEDSVGESEGSWAGKLGANSGQGDRLRVGAACVAIVGRSSDKVNIQFVLARAHVGEEAAGNVI